METSKNESDSEETVPVPKSIFKRQASSSIPRFDVSLNESNSKKSQFNKSDTITTISTPERNRLFIKRGKPAQQNFVVNFEESNVNSQTGSSITCDFSKPKLPFERRVVSSTSNIVTNQFDVTFNETNADLSEKNSLEETSKVVDDDSTNSISLATVSNPFKKPNLPSKNVFNIEFDDTSNIVTNQFDVTFNETNADLSEKNSLEKTNKVVDDDSTNSISLATVSNPFKKPKLPSKNVFNIEFDETSNDDNSTVSTSLTKVMFKRKLRKPLDQFQVSYNGTNNDSVSDPADKTENKLSQEDFFNKEVFAKPTNNNLKNAFNVEYEDSDFGGSSEVTSSVTTSKFVFRAPKNPSQNFEVSYSPTMPQITSSQEEESRNENVINSDSEMDREEENCSGKDVESSDESLSNNDEEMPDGNDDETSEGQNKERQSVECEDIRENLSSTKSLLNTTNRSNRSETHLYQSSVNDDNLNVWMSDHSDEEIQPPTVPDVPRNASFTEEVLQTPAPVSPTQTCTMTWEQKFHEMVSNIKKKHQLQKESNLLNLEKVSKTQAISKPKPNKVEGDEKAKKTRHPKLIKPAYFATKRLYQYIIKKLEPKFGIDAVLQSEQIVLSICDTVKKVERRKSHQKKLIQDLKKEMASVGLIETTVDFYEFVIKFLPHSFRVKVIPCVQPRTNTVYPPKDTINPFDKIL